MRAVLRYVCFLTFFGLLLPAGPAVLAADEEDDRVRLIVPGGTGGGSDLVARRLAPLLGEALGTPVDVISRPGRNGLRALAEAAPDGETLALLGPAMLLDAGETMPRLTPVALIGRDGVALHLGAGAAADSVLAEVLDGGAMASGGPEGSLWHLALAHLAASRGARLPDAAWRPAADEAAALDLLSDGAVALAVSAPSQADAARRAGRVVSLAGPDAVTGLPEALAGWRGVVGPPGMSDRTAARIADAVAGATTDETFRRFMRVRGYRVAAAGPEDFARLLARFERELRAARSALE